MLTFSKDFFLEETRNDFYIEPMMKRAWAAQLEVLAVIEQICNKYGLHYFAFWGTLLGAVRHNGFIPWDDDIDICMLREDYEKFLAVAGKELPGEYQILDLYIKSDWDQVFARIVNADTVSYEAERLKKFHGCPYAVGIDIFPLDEIPEDPQLENYHTELFSTLFSAGQCYELEPSEIVEILPDLEDLYGTKFDRTKNIANQLLKAADVIGKEYFNSGSPIITSMSYNIQRKRFLRKEWFQDYVLLPFEEVRIPVPVEYDAVLTVLYGDDYMTPVRYEVHDYPFYKKQQAIYEQVCASGNS